MKLTEMILGVSEVSDSLNRIGDQLRATYDTQTFEEFASYVTSHQDKLQTASFSGHKHCNDKLAKMVSLPHVIILSLRDTSISDIGVFFLSEYRALHLIFLGLAAILAESPQLRVLDISWSKVFFF